MGTSGSSTGPGSGVPLVPPWVTDPDIAAPSSDEGDDTDTEQEAGGEDAGGPSTPVGIAPDARFRGARFDLGQFASSGSGNSLRRGLGNYIRTGLGGTRQASQRMAGTARKTGALYGVLHALSTGSTPTVDLGIDPAQLTGRPARETADRIAHALSPTDGTQDAEASRRSISLALRELVAEDPTADLTALTEQQIELVMEMYVGHDICRRIELDVGKTILDRAPDAATAIRRLDEMYSYVRQCVAAAFRRRRGNKALSKREASRLATRVIRDTFEVFESHLS